MNCSVNIKKYIKYRYLILFLFLILKHIMFDEKIKIKIKSEHNRFCLKR